MDGSEKDGAPRPSAMDRTRFIETFGGVYEHSPWIAEAAFDTRLTTAHDDPAALHAALRDILERADDEARLALLRAHPDLAGRLAIGGGLTAESTSEQAGAGLDRCTPEEYAEFRSLNDRYVEKFGFPFILAVRGLDRARILENFRARIDNDRDTEFAEALAQVHRIAQLRIDAIFEGR